MPMPNHSLFADAASARYHGRGRGAAPLKWRHPHLLE
jgi:hypothetical protein